MIRKQFLHQHGNSEDFLMHLIPEVMEVECIRVKMEENMEGNHQRPS